MSKKEQEFYKAFDIPKVYSMDINIGDLDAQWITATAPTLKKLWNKCGGFIGNSAGGLDFWDEDKTPIPYTFKDFEKSDLWEEHYPPITDRILLSLYCLWSINTENDKLIRFECPENLKAFTLEHLIRLAKNKCVYYAVHNIMRGEDE